MFIEIVETIKKLSDGSILHPGDILDIDEEKALRLIGKGRARPLPSGATGDAPSCPEEESGKSTSSPATKEAAAPVRYYVGDRVRFAHKRALDVLEGVVLEARWYRAPIRRWWYRIKSGKRNFWVSESHVQAGDRT